MGCQGKSRGQSGKSPESLRKVSGECFLDGNGNGNFEEINSNDFLDGNWESMEIKGRQRGQDGNGNGNSSELQDGNGNLGPWVEKPTILFKIIAR